MRPDDQMYVLRHEYVRPKVKLMQNSGSLDGFDKECPGAVGSEEWGSVITVEIQFVGLPREIPPFASLPNARLCVRHVRSVAENHGRVNGSTRCASFVADPGHPQADLGVPQEIATIGMSCGVPRTPPSGLGGAPQDTLSVQVLIHRFVSSKLLIWHGLRG